MTIYRGIRSSFPKVPRAVTVGIFDGIHRGHRKILRAVLAAAKKRRLKSMVVTFDPHPAKVLKHVPSVPFLMSLEHRLRAFAKLGFAEALVIRFDPAFSRVTRGRFIEGLLLQKLRTRFLAVGHDFRFGHKAGGDADFLRVQARRLRFDFLSVTSQRHAGRVISSTRVRELIEKGELALARKMLGRPVSVYGTVVRGRGRGRGLGFATANLDPHHETLPPPGVYAALGILDGRRLPGVLHVGARPTFGEKNKTLEIHFFNFHNNIYGKDLEVFFLKKLRNTRRFKSPAALGAAVRKDIRKARRVLANFPLQSLFYHV